MSKFSLSKTIKPKPMPSAFCALEKGTHLAPLSQSPPSSTGEPYKSR